jgi:DNA-binding NarL/FixJ family response regulator
MRPKRLRPPASGCASLSPNPQTGHQTGRLADASALGLHQTRSMPKDLALRRATATTIDRDNHPRPLVSVDAIDESPALEKGGIGVLIACGDNLARIGVRALLDTERDIAVVGCAADGDQAVALAGQLQPDVVLVDVALPGIDAVELMRRLALDADASGARVLILSGSEQDEEVFSSLRAGASGFLRRDLEPAELIGAVRTVAAGNAVLSPRVVRRVIAEIASQPDPGLPLPDQLDDLTAREREVMALVAAGLSNDQIAEHLVVTRATAKTHVSRALGKVGARSRAQLVTLAYETGLVLPKVSA